MLQRNAFLNPSMASKGEPELRKLKNLFLYIFLLDDILMDISIVYLLPYIVVI